MSAYEKYIKERLRKYFNLEKTINKKIEELGESKVKDINKVNKQNWVDKKKNELGDNFKDLKNKYDNT